jgi:peptidoglycan/LPS O-acetylase OafA/YrhL
MIPMPAAEQSPAVGLKRSRPDIEGLRAVAILLVVAFHAGVPGLAGGFIGVDVFFVLSGYLITSLLVREAAQTGRLDLLRFYARRARRLLPAAALVLLTTLVIGRLVSSPLEMKRLGATALATSVYASNIYFIRQATNYLAAENQANPLLHTWSLGVEEQFYLFWPLLVLAGLALTRRARADRRLWQLLGAVALASFAASFYFTRTVEPWAFFGSPLRAWEFAAGGLAATLPITRGKHGMLEHGLAWGGLGLIVLGGVLFGSSTPFPGAAALLPVTGTALVLAACAPAPELGVGRLLGHPLLQAVGRLSYSWYLWHWPVLVYADELGLARTLPARLAWSTLALCLAALTFRTLEDPIRHHRALLPRPGLTLVLAGCLTVVVAGCSVWFRSEAIGSLQSPEQVAYLRASETESAPAGCQLGYLETESPLCEFGDTSAATLVVLLGDSHATEWLPAIDGAGRKRGWRVRLVSKADCPAVSVEIFSGVLQRPYSECARWRETMLARIAAWHPAMVLLSHSTGYVDGNVVAHPVSLAGWREGLRLTFAALTGTGARVAVLRDSPKPRFRVPECLSRAAFAPLRRAGGCSIERSTAVDTLEFAVELQAAAEADPPVTVLDFTDAFCGPVTCSPVIGGTVVYKDANHITAAFSATLAGTLASRLDPRAGQAPGPAP